MSKVAKVKFRGYEKSIFQALDLLKVPEKLPQRGLIIIKPNLTNSSPPPVTTPVQAVEAVYRYLLLHTGAEIAIGEGTGSGDTFDVYQKLGYADLAREQGIELIDFNRESAIILKLGKTFCLKAFHMPEILQNAWVISLPVLKDHLFTVTTISMKNMFGIAPAPFYRGTWNKSRLHTPSAHRSVFDICMYKKPNLCIVDASTALSGSHLSGKKVELGFIMAGFDPVAVDASASRLLGHDPTRIEYLRLSHGELGDMEKIEIINE